MGFSMNSKTSKEFGFRLRKVRIKSKLTQKQLAYKVDLTTSSICAYENGRYTPTLEVIYRLAYVMAIDLDELVGH